MAIEQTPELERALQLAADRHASDLFLLPHEPITLRVRGKIERMQGNALLPDEVRKIALAAAGQERLAKLAGESGRVVTSCSLPGVISGQMCIASSRGEYTIAVRLVSTRVFEPKYLAVPEAIVHAAQAPSGLLVFAGIPGSGKTTTVFSLLEEINRTRSVHICTVEDPICVALTPKNSLIQQREIGVDVPDCISGIVAAMRQDVDVLFIGELKTVEEVDAAISAAQLGHLVMIQINKAQMPGGAVQRLIEIQPPESAAVFRRTLARVLRGVLSQILLPRAADKGNGLIAAYGVLVPDDEMRRAIADGRDLFDRTQPLPDGCQSMPESIERLRADGIIAESTAREAMETLRVQL